MAKALTRTPTHNPEQPQITLTLTPTATSTYRTLGGKIPAGPFFVVEKLVDQTK